MTAAIRHSRETVIKAAGKLFARRGYHGTSMRDLGNELGLLKSSIYSHVASKEDLLLEVVKRAERLFNKAARNALETSSEAGPQLQALIAGHLQVLLDHRDEARTFLNEAEALDARHRAAVLKARDSYENVFRQVITAGIKSGEFHRRTDPVVSGIFLLSVLNAVGRWYRPDGRLSPGDLAEEIWEFVSSGLVNSNAAQPNGGSPQA